MPSQERKPMYNAQASHRLLKAISFLPAILIFFTLVCGSAFAAQERIKSVACDGSTAAVETEIYEMRSLSMNTMLLLKDKINEYIITVKKENPSDYEIIYTEIWIAGDRDEYIMTFSPAGKFLYRTHAVRLKKRTADELRELENTFVFEVNSKHPQSPLIQGNFDEKSFALSIDKKTMRIVRELRVQ